MPHGRARARVVLRLDAADAGLYSLIQRLIESLDAIGHTALAGPSGKTVDGITVPQGLLGFGQQHQGLPFRLIGPAPGGTGHGDHEHHRDVALVPVHVG